MSPMTLPMSAAPFAPVCAIAAETASSKSRRPSVLGQVAREKDSTRSFAVDEVLRLAAWNFAQWSRGGLLDHFSITATTSASESSFSRPFPLFDRSEQQAYGETLAVSRFHGCLMSCRCLPQRHALVSSEVGSSK